MSWTDAHQARRYALAALGLLSLVPYTVALRLNDLRANTVGFELTYFAAFALYLVAVVLVLRDDRPGSGRRLLAIFAFGLAFRTLLVFSTPTLTDDMYRYVWDGRIQASGLNPRFSILWSEDLAARLRQLSSARGDRCSGC